MICKLTPSTKDYIWGGTKLKEIFAKKANTDIIAETWELSCHADGDSYIDSDCTKTLREFLSENPCAKGTACEQFSNFPILIKMIDAANDLSIQVHPSDEFALENENQFGKTEMWYIVDCEKDASLYYGFKEEVSALQLENAIKNNTLCDLLNKVKVKKGDVFFIEAGTIHAIGKGILIAEIQQNSNITYRVYDYGRLGADGKPRDLHIEKACKVSKLTPEIAPVFEENHVAQCKCFTVDKIDVNGNYTDNCDETSFHALLFTEGSTTIKYCENGISANMGDTVFIAANTGEYTVESKGNCTYLKTYVEMPKTKKYRIGIDLGGTNIKTGVVDENNNILATHKIKTLVNRPWQEIAKDMANSVYAALEKLNLSIEDCKSVGIGSPGIVDFKTGNVVYSNNFPNWEYIPLGEKLETLLNIPVKITNDANCAALGEAVAGAAKGKTSVILLTLGTGVGGGIISEGKIFEGDGAGGAELGHSTLIFGGELCTCGRKGCLESYASATALISRARKSAQENPNSLLAKMCEGNLENMDGIIPFESARQGDKTAQNVVNNYINYLSEGIVNFINIFRPKIVLLSGGICGEGNALTDPINEYVKKYAFGGYRVDIPPVVCAILGNDAGIIGAANLN